MSGDVERPRWAPRWLHSAALGTLGGNAKDDDGEAGPVSGALDGAVLADGPGAAIGFVAGLWAKVRRRRGHGEP